VSHEGRRIATRLSHLGRDPRRFDGAVNTPVYRASTILSPDLAHWENPERGRIRGTVTYGRAGTPTSYSFEDTVADLEGAAGAVSVSSGLAAIAFSILPFVDSGDHILMTDSVYWPARKFCDQQLRRMGVETTYYDPAIGEGVKDLIRPNTRLAYLESPGSLTFEVQDVPAIASVAKAAGLVTVADNSWATPLYFRPLEHGVDISLHAATKYIVGHSDAMLGIVAATAECEARIRDTARTYGVCAGTEELYLGLRGLRTLAVRLPRHQETGLKLAAWLSDRPEVDRVMHPALPGDPGHALWQRDFDGASGLFGFVLARDYPQPAVAAMLDGLELFGMGASWGGFESLIITARPERGRSATEWKTPGRTLRIAAGLEDPDDLIADLDAGFERLNATC
jgi:cystathionine beta-lyase